MRPRSGTPLAARIISPGLSCPEWEAGWCGNSRFILINPGQGSPPHTLNPSPPEPFRTTTVKMESGKIIQIIFKLDK